MNYMQKEMREQLMQDIQSGKIWGLKLTKTHVDAIRENVYADIYLVPREIVKWDDKVFYAKTRLKNGAYELCEGYYDAFNYYDGNILRGVDEIPMAVNPEDSVQITEFEIIWCY